MPISDVVSSELVIHFILSLVVFFSTNKLLTFVKYSGHTATKLLYRHCCYHFLVTCSLSNLYLRICAAYTEVRISFSKELGIRKQEEAVIGFLLFLTTTLARYEKTNMYEQVFSNNVNIVSSAIATPWLFYLGGNLL